MHITQTLGHIWPALRQASDAEAVQIASGLNMISRNAGAVPLMDLRYSLDKSAQRIIGRYVALD
jgi:hypothetical protein